MATIDWEGKLYIGIALNCDYEKVTFQNSMPGYVVHHYTHSNNNNTKTLGLTIPLDTTHLWVKKSDAIRKVAS